jgi:hypothetical protein
MQSSRKLRAVALLAAVLAALILTACGGITAGGGGVRGDIQRLGPLVKQCDGKPDVVVDDVDESGSDRRTVDPLTDPRLAEIGDTSNAVAACGGSESVIAFSSSLSDTATLASTTFPTSYGTTNARLIHNSKIETSFLTNVASAMRKPSMSVGRDGTDIMAQLDLAAQEAEANPSARVDFTVETDGMSTIGAVRDANPKTFTIAVAEREARTVKVPHLGSNTTFSMVGVGKTAASGQHQPPTAYVLALTTFYRLVCERTGANCSVTTTYPNGD